jgi:hypothetical protein
VINSEEPEENGAKRVEFLGKGIRQKIVERYSKIVGLVKQIDGRVDLNGIEAQTVQPS